MELFAKFEERIERLEQENRGLRAQSAALEAQVAQLQHFQGRKVIAEPAPLERSVTISEIPAGSSFIMPTDSQLEALAKIVGAKYPSMTDTNCQGFHGDVDSREQDWWKQFKAAFRAIGAFGRLDQPDRKKYLSYHISAIENHLRTIRSFENLRVGPFLCAVLSHGDIPYAGLEKIPEIGLAGPNTGRPATDAWRKVLNGSILPMGGPAPGRIEQTPSPVRIIGQGYNG